jgi:lipopolysaccharide/colanic/teichoic acid biosynthesis glycosyltransferase
MKRAMDVVIATLLLLVVLPALVLALIGSAIALRTWPLFTQTRVGRNGRPLRVVKVRTLPASAPRYADKYTVASIQLPAFCRLLRRLHLDELPQLVHVIGGSMSLVGPRPEMPQLHAAMDDDFAARRTSVRPGCTGLWQVSDAVTGLIVEAPEFDDFYVGHQSLRLDLRVLWRTARLMVPIGRPRPITRDDLVAWAPGASSALPVAAAEAS